MVGGGVLQECLESADVERVLSIGRRSVGKVHPKLEEILLDDLENLEPVAPRLAGYNACFHCMGVSALGMSEARYEALTYGISDALVRALLANDTDYTVIYVSGQGTNADGTLHWQKVKGQTENRVLEAGFRDAYAFRPGVILPEKGIRSATGWYNMAYGLMRPFYPLLRKMKSVTTTAQLGRAMLSLVREPQPTKVVEAAQIRQTGG